MSETSKRFLTEPVRSLLPYLTGLGKMGAEYSFQFLELGKNSKKLRGRIQNGFNRMLNICLCRWVRRPLETIHPLQRDLRDSNSCGQSPLVFETNSLTARTRCLVWKKRLCRENNDTLHGSKNSPTNKIPPPGLEPGSVG